MSDFPQEIPELKHLYDKYIANEMSEDEFNKLYNALSEPEKEVLLIQLMTETWNTTTPLPVFMYDEPAESEISKNKKIFFLKTSWFRIAAAVILLLATGAFLWINRNNEPTPARVIAVKQPSAPDILPASDKSTITLADGTVIALDTATNGILAQQGNINVLKLNTGQLSYNNGSTPPAGSDTLFNKIATSRGNRYQVILPDGTNVWLNAASSIRFPAIFPKTRRVVELNGEAYFDVVKDPEKPFTVKCNTVTYDVLGTSFDIRSYLEDQLSTTVLISGKLLLKNNYNTKVLQPGQFAAIGNNDILNNALLGPFPESERVMEAQLSWMKGMFIFNKTSLNMIMGEFCRWYDVDVVYKGDMRLDYFTGRISRSVPLAKALKLLEMTNTLHFKLNGRTIEVSH